MEDQIPADEEFGTGVPDEAPVEEPVVNETTEPEQNIVAERLRSLGYDVPEDADDAAILESLAGGWKEVESLRPEIEEYRKSKDELAAWKADKEKAAQAPKVERAKRPEVSETAQRLMDSGLISVDPKTGLYTSDDGRLQPYVDEANTAAQWQRKRASRLVENPLEALKEEGLEDYINQRLQSIESKYQQELERRIAALQTSSQLEKFWSENGSEFYQKDHSGQVLYSGGHPLLNEKGKAYQAAYKAAGEKYGITDPVRAHELALELSAHVKSPTPKGKTISQKVNEIRGTNRLNGSRTVAAALSKQGDEDIDVETIWLEEAHKLR